MAHSNGVCLVWGETVTSCLKPSSCINNTEKWPRPEPLRVLASPSRRANSANKNKSCDCQRLKKEKRLARKGHRQGLGQPTTLFGSCGYIMVPVAFTNIEKTYSTLSITKYHKLTREKVNFLIKQYKRLGTC